MINEEAADAAPFLWDLFWGNTPGFVYKRLPEVSQGNNTHRSKCGKENKPFFFIDVGGDTKAGKAIQTLFHLDVCDPGLFFFNIFNNIFTAQSGFIWTFSHSWSPHSQLGFWAADELKPAAHYAHSVVCLGGVAIEALRDSLKNNKLTPG